MKTAAMILLLALAGCAISPERMARQTDWEVCRLSMSQMQGAVAAAEAKQRGLDCAPLYPAIAAQEMATSAAMANMLHAAQPMFQRQPVYVPPPAINCTSQRFGTRVDTTCN